MICFLAVYVPITLAVFLLLQINNGWRCDYEEFCARLGMSLLWPSSLARDCVLWIVQKRWEKEQEARRQARQQEDEGSP